jgi:hypothetical protein
MHVPVRRHIAGNLHLAQGLEPAGLQVSREPGPSLILEGHAYNAPSEKLGVSYNSTVADCLNWHLETDRTQLVQAPANGYAGGTLDMPAVVSGVLAFDSA